MTIDFHDLEWLIADAAAAGAEPPPPRVRERLMARVQAGEPALPAGFVFSFAETDPRLPHPVAGIRMRVLSINRDIGYATILLDVDPGTRFPPHHHGGAEECLVISGSVHTLGRRMGPGDFLHADAGTDHGELWTEEGAEVLLVVPFEDYMVAPTPK